MNTDFILQVIEMLESCAFWAIAFIIVFTITRLSGMKQSLPKETKSRLHEVKEECENFKRVLTDNKDDRENDLIDEIKKLHLVVRGASRIFAVYQYDHPLAPGVNDVSDSLSSIKEDCQEISYLIQKGKVDEIVNNLILVESRVEDTLGKLDKVIEAEEEERFKL